MNIIIKVVTTKKFQFNNQNYVGIEGFANGLGIIRQTVKEELVPDELEGKTIKLGICLGLVNYKPSLKVKSLEIVEGDIE